MTTRNRLSAGEVLLVLLTLAAGLLIATSLLKGQQDPTAAGEGSKEKKPSHYLIAQRPDLCLTCHDAGNAKLAVAHQKQPLEESNDPQYGLVHEIRKELERGGHR